LPRDPARLRPLLQEAGLIDDQDATARVSALLDNVVAQILLDSVGIPGGSVEETL
jgi:hypothetical protein